MAQRGRVNGGRVEAWKAALAYLKESQRLIIQVGIVVLATVLVINLPLIPGTGFARGAATGTLVTAFVWLIAWVAWVSSGLAHRLQGTFAEEAVTDSIRKSRYVFDVVASLKFGSEDVDQVLISPAGVVALETKWRSRTPSEVQLLADAHHASRAARSLRNTLLSVQAVGLPPELVTAALVICGPGRKGVHSRRVETGLGPVDVINFSDLDQWLGRQGRGIVGPDFAQTLAGALHQLARDRDRAAVSAGPFVRWLARER